MQETGIPSFSAFLGLRRLAQGPLPEVARALASARPATGESVLVFDADARLVELDLRGTPDEVAARAAQGAAPQAPPAAAPRGRGRPQLGVVAREVTLLPRHWDWLAAQPGGASVTLRLLVEEARRSGGDRQAVQGAQERAYRFLTAIAGNLPGYEEVIRALFARDAARFSAGMAEWPSDLREHARLLAAGAFEQEESKK
jgi:hypothetical protein